MAKAEDAVTRATRLLGRLAQVEYQHRDGSCPEPPARLESALEPFLSALLSGDPGTNDLESAASQKDLGKCKGNSVLGTAGALRNKNTIADELEDCSCDHQ